MPFPVLPLMAPFKLLVLVKYAGCTELLMELTAVADKLIIGSAIESQRRKLRPVPGEGLKNIFVSGVGLPVRPDDSCRCPHPPRLRPYRLKQAASSM